MTEADLKAVYEIATLCREFELSVAEKVRTGIVTIPVYLSAGQEYGPACLAFRYRKYLPGRIQTFIQHRGHSIYLAFGGSVEALIYELLGDSRGCSGGYGGSASIQSYDANIFGHDGLMGSHGPISVGMCYANRVQTLCFIGDAAAEEDYFLASLGWASTKKLPILFLIDDNNLSILTEKAVRRNWNIVDVAKGFGIRSFDVSDDPNELLGVLPQVIDSPVLVNVNTTRLLWHAGAGKDGDYFDRHADVGGRLDSKWTSEINENIKMEIASLWETCLANRSEKQ